MRRLRVVQHFSLLAGLKRWQIAAKRALEPDQLAGGGAELDYRVVEGSLPAVGVGNARYVFDNGALCRDHGCHVAGKIGADVPVEGEEQHISDEQARQPN